jgi:hypothetical protein
MRMPLSLVIALLARQLHIRCIRQTTQGKGDEVVILLSGGPSPFHQAILTKPFIPPIDRCLCLSADVSFVG